MAPGEPLRGSHGGQWLLLRNPSLDSSSESKNGTTPACRVDIIDEIPATSNACNASSSQSPRGEQNVTDMIEYFNNQARLLRNTNKFGWRHKQAESSLKRIVNVALALPVTQASVERTFSGLRYTLKELRLGIKENIIEAIMLQRRNT